MSKKEYVVALLFLFIGIGIASMLMTVLYYYPLTYWAVNDISWTKTWLFMTVVDYYGSTFCLCSIAILNESGITGILWSLGFCLLGSPVCCAYVIYR
jgi:hypothetical protein